MAVNQHESSLRLTVKNDASKPLKQAADDLGRFEDAVKAGGTALDNHTGNIRDFGKAAQNVFKPLGDLGKQAVGKLTAAVEQLDGALEDTNANIGVTKNQIQSYKDAAAAVDAQIDAVQKLRDAEDARRTSESSNLAHLKDAEAEHLAAVRKSADAQIAGINEATQARRDELAAIDAQISAEQKLANARDKKLAKASKDIDESVAKQRELEEARSKAAPDLAPFDAQIAKQRQLKEAADAELKARQSAHSQSVAERREILAQRKVLLDNARVEKTSYEQRKQRFADARASIRAAMKAPGANLMALVTQDAANTRGSGANEAAFKAFSAENLGQRKALTAHLADLGKRIEAEKAAADAVKTTVDAHASEIARLNELRKPTADRVADIDKQIAAEEKAQARRRTIIDEQIAAQAQSAKVVKDLAKARDAIVPDVTKSDADIETVNKTVAAEKVASDARIKAQKDLTDAVTTESKERIAAANKELAELSKARTAENARVRAGIKAQATLDERRERITSERDQAAAMRDRAVFLNRQITDPTALRRVARTIGSGPETQSRGMAALTEQTRKAADAQRLLNGEVKRGNSGFNSARSYIMGLVSAYALYATAITQASKAIDAYKAKESFQITVSNTLGGDMAKAAGEFDYLTETANKYGFAISAISQEYAKLAATARGIGRSDKDVRALFEGVLSVGRVNALSDEKMQDAFRAITQILSKNQVMSEELKGQLAEAIPRAVVDFAQSQGYGPDQMKQFSKDLEDGKFASRDIIEYAEKQLADNANAVLRAQNTFQATMARFQNTLFKSRTDFAENGFMDGLTETIRELDEFFKSEDGKAYLIRLGEGAKVAVDALALLARNLDTIIALAGTLGAVWGAKKIGGAATGIASFFADAKVSAAAASGAIGTAGKSAAGAARSFGMLAAVGRGLLGVFGGPVGLVAMLASLGAGALWSWTSSQNAEQAAQAQSRMERIRDVIGEIRSAAVEADGDVSKFVKNLGAIRGMTDTQQMELRRDVVQAKADVRDAVSEVISDAFAKENGSRERARQLLRDGVITVNSGDTAKLARIGSQIQKGGFDPKVLNAELDAIAKANPAMTESVVKMQRLVEQMVELEAAQTDVTQAIENANNAGETAEEQMKRHTTENRNSAEAASLAASAQQDFEDALTKASDAAGDTEGYDAYAKAMKEAEDLRESATKALDKWIEQQKLAGKALRADDIARQTARISEAVGKMTSKAVQDLREFQMAARGLSVELDAVSSGMLDAYRQREQFGQTQLDPLGTVGGASNGRRYGADKRSVAVGIVDTAKALGISAEDLATVISYETGGTFDPLKRGPTTQHGQHRGLIQFGVPQARENGVNWDDPINSQLGPDGAIARYLRKAGVKPGMGILDVYSAINAGRVGRYNASDANNGGAPGTVRDKVEKQMGGHRANARSLLGDYASGSSVSVEERELAAHVTQNISTALSDQAKLAVQHAAIDNPSLWKNPEFVAAYRSGDARGVADQLRASGDASRADEVIRTSAGTEMVRQIEANADAVKTFATAVEKISFDKDDMKAGNRAAAVDRETAALIKDLTADGADLAAATKTATEDEARALVRSRVERQMQLDIDKQRRDLAEDSAESTAQALRDDRQRIEVQRIHNEQGERAAELARIHNELRNEDEDRGYSRSDAERNEIANWRIRAWDAENAERLANEAKDKADKAKDDAEKVHTDKIATLQSKLAYLNDQLAVATENRDVESQARLKDEIRGVSDELVTATESARAFYETLSGPEGQQGILTMDRLKLETQRAAEALKQASPEITEISAVIENSLNGAVSTFAQNMRNGMGVWKSFASAATQAIGEVLVNIGKMIVQAVIANSVMSALGLPSQYATPAQNAATAQSGGILSSVVGVLGGMIGGKHHDGGVIGDPSKNIDFLASLINLRPGERPIIAMDGEEMLTRRDPRHRDNLGAAFSRMSRFHSGGVIGGSPDTLSRAMAASGSVGRAIGQMQPGAGQSETNVNVINAFDEQEVMDRYLSTPAGQRSIINVLGKNKSRLRGMFG